MKVTAETITDEQIRELRRSFGAGIGHRDDCGCKTCLDTRSMHAYCDMAMWGYLGEPEQRIAVERCVAAWNFRHGGTNG